MQIGATPSVSEVAQAAGVSRATAYRTFSSQAALVEAVVAEALGPILEWRPQGSDPQARVAGLIAAAMPRIDAHEATFRAALRLTLDRWAAARNGAATGGAFSRGHRVGLLREALKPLRATLPSSESERLAQALSLLFGVEALVILKDIWKLDMETAQDVVRWAAAALIAAAVPGPAMEAWSS